MVELSAPTFKSFDAVCQLLDSVPVAWAILPPELFSREVKAGFAKALGAHNPPFAVYYESPVQPLSDVNLEGGTPSAALEALRSTPRLRSLLLDAARVHALTYDSLKIRAAAVRNPLEPLLSRIRDTQLRETPSGIFLSEPLNPEYILERAGGLDGFPAYQIFQSLNVTRLKDPKYVTVSNDIFDEWHAVYAAYSSATALDRRTYGRLRSTRLPVVSRVTSSLADLPGILGRRRGMAATP
jgi:hypothetical protein